MIQPYNLPPINPAAFGGLPEAPQGGQQQPTQGGQGQPPMDMNKYLIDKVMEIKRRMGGGGSMGALGAISDAMMQQPQPQGGQEPQPQPQQPPMRA
jgi:hypothetical protein|tara:strand:+ start:661 stop:948 length:288 start_codon:yes stop_codon:yes gene_type:complete